MSFAINWDRLLAAEPELCTKAVSFLNDYIADRLPPYLQYLRITRLSFGARPPAVELLDITQPTDAFYTTHASSRANSPVATATSTAANSERSTSSFSGPRQHIYDPKRDVENNLHRQPQPPHRRHYYKSPLDTQLALRINYEGQQDDAELWLETELQLNIPSPSFISLPMRLHLSHLRFSGTLLVAYLTHYNTLSYSFRHSSASFSDSEDAGDAKNNEEVTVDLRIESELGDRERQVMKNVAKIERFLVDLIRRLVTEDLAYPNCRSIRLFRHTGGGGEQYFPGVDADLDFGQSAFSDYEID